MEVHEGVPGVVSSDSLDTLLCFCKSSLIFAMSTFDKFDIVYSLDIDVVALGPAFGYVGHAEFCGCILSFKFDVA